jgi:predicted transposase YbfD/YdcC
MLDLEGCTVTTDAIGCQKNIAQQIVNANASLGLKGNQGNTFEAVKSLFSCEEEDGFKNVAHTLYETLEKNHGRLETRTVYSTHIYRCS